MGDIMDNESKNKKSKYINEFPLIIMVAVAIIAIVLINVYLSFKPYNTIYTNGFAVLSENMTYNLTNNSTKTDELDVGVVGVTNGDSIYKQVDSYYVGVEEKKEIDYDYPIYSTDGLTIHTINDNFSLIDRNFNTVSGYSKMAISFGVVYNEGDSEPADDIEYILAYLNNSAFIGLQTITIKTAYNEYNIPINSPIYFNTKYINYYIFDGERFSFNKINDIYYDSVIKIGNVNMTYEEFLLKLNVIKKFEENEEDNVKEEVIETPIKQEDDKQEDDTFIKPTVSVDDFVVNVYSMQSNITISDPTGAITSNPTFEIYKSDGKLSLRKKISVSGLFNISGLNPSTEYNIVGTYKYKNKQGLTMVVTFFEGKITTKDISSLDEINLTSSVGDRYANKLEIKDLTVTNSEIETVKGIKKIVLDVWENGKTTKTSFNLSYSNMSNLIKGNPILITTPSSLISNTVYNYEIKFYDGNSNELKTSGKSSGVIQTTKAVPTLKFSSEIDKNSNKVNLNIITQNKDDVYINDYNYKLYSYSGLLIDEGTLNYENKLNNKLIFDNLDYNTNYKIIVTGTYDVEDGRGIQELYEEKTFTTANLSSVINAWYDEENKIVTNNSIYTKIYISPKTTILDKEDTEVIVYLKDKDGNDILDSEGNLRYSNSYIGIEKDDTGYYFIDNTFEGLESNTEYILTLKFVVKQIENELFVEKQLFPSITTLTEESYVEVKYKKLLGETLDLSFDVVDPNKLIDDSKINVEIYEGKFDNLDDINTQYIYRKVIAIDNNNDDRNLNKTNINLTLDGYSSDYYTIKISAKPYKKKDVEQVIPIKSNIEDTNLIVVDRNTNVKLEMYQQLKSEKDSTKYLTEVNIKYNLGETSSNLYAVDCNNNKCKVIGYIDSNNSFTSLNNSATYESMDSVDEWNNGRLKFLNNTNEDHVLYLTIEKPNVDLSIKGSKSFSKDELEYLYILNSLDYTTNYELYNISVTDDLFNTNKIKTNGETRHYVVTGNLDLKREDGSYYLKSYRFTNFNGSIDFQGHSLTLYKNIDSNATLFNYIGKNGVIKNVLLNYELGYVGVTNDAFWIYNNAGTIENAIVHVNQLNDTGRISNIGFLSYYNYGTIKNFALYLDSDIHTYTSSSLVVYNNASINSVVKYGAVIPLNDSKVYLYDSSSNHGSFVYYNSGTVKNVYNLADVLSATSGSGSIATIVRSNERTGNVFNTLSVATTTINNVSKGQNVYYTFGKTSNNYYVDTNILNPAYKNSYNKKISKASLRNAGILNVILNPSTLDSDDKGEPFSITSGYYPIINMSNFMTDYQKPIEITFDMKDSTIDIVSTEVINDNRENNGVARVRVYISNPNKLDITSIKVKGATTSISLDPNDTTYDENYQITSLVLNMSLEASDDIATTNYDITSMTYKSSLGDEITKNYYPDSNPRNIEITLYNLVDNYEGLIASINKNQNTYLLKDINIDRNTKVNGVSCLSAADGENFDNINDRCLPSTSVTYSAKFDGNQKTLDLGMNNIKRGYFFYNTTGTIDNLQVRNLRIKSDSYYIGFIRYTESAYITNVDITTSNILIDRRGINNTNQVYLGTLVAYSNYTKFNKISINDATMRKDSTGGVLYRLYAGGIIGYTINVEINDSYVFNYDAKVTLDTLIGYQTIGGIVGYSDARSNSASTAGTTINNCYTTGLIDTELSNIGGIAGTISHGYVENSYSTLNISSTGAYVGGIVGNYMIYWSVQGVTNNLYLGTLTNLNNKPNYDPITSLSSAKTNKNYTLDSNLANLTSFMGDDGHFVQKEEGLEWLPYLNLENSSFVEQKVKDLKAGEKILNEFDYTFEYELDNDCLSLLDEEFKNDESYVNACAISATLNTTKPITIENGLSSDENLKIELLSDTGDVYKYQYKISPNDRYFSSSLINYMDSNNSSVEQKIVIPFFKQIKGKDDWHKFNIDQSTLKFVSGYQNVLLLTDLEIDPDGNIDTQQLGTKTYTNTNVYDVNKRVDNFYGNNKTIKMVGLNEDAKTDKDSITYSFIYWLDGTMRDLTITDFKISGYNSNYSALIRFNNGVITKSKFTNINIVNYANIVGVVGLSTGYINNVEIDNIDLTGFYYVGGLVGYDTSLDAYNTHITDIKASNINIKGYARVGGVIGQVDYFVKNVEASNVTIQGYEGYPLDSGYKDNITSSTVKRYIYPRESIGGIIGYGDCRYCTLTSTEDKINKILIDRSEYVGGIGGRRKTDTSQNNLIVKNLLITTDPNINSTKLSIYNRRSSSIYIGGTYGFGIYHAYNDVENIVIAQTTPELFGKSFDEITVSDLKESKDKDGVYSDINATYVGSIAGLAYSSNRAYIKDSLLYANTNVGGVMGSTSGWTGITYGNAVSNTNVYASGSNAGGVIGLFYGAITGGSLGIYHNIVLNSNISAKTNAGGIVGNFDNTNTYSQNTPFYRNFVENCIVEANSTDGVAGGLIGRLYQTPLSEIQRFNNSLIYGTVTGKVTGYGIGSIDNLTTSSFYQDASSVESISIQSGFKEYVSVLDLKDYQINSASKLHEYLTKDYSSIYTNPINDNYFPTFIANNYPSIPTERRVELPQIQSFARSFMAPRMRMMRNYAVAYSYPVNINYNIYASDVDKINIEFSNIDPNNYFYYEIGDYKSNNISIENRVYTIGYDYKTPIKIYVSNGSNYKTETINPNDLSKKVSIIDGKSYYITDGILYGEDNSYVGGFINLYNDKALTTDNKIYYITTNEFIDNYINYDVLDTMPLYSFNYNGKSIKTYYNFAMIDDSIQNYQIIVKNGMLSIINSNLNNKKNSYIIDYYNNNEIQIVLKNNGELYSLKSDIKYPKDLVNNDIVELYTNIYSQDTIAIIRYKNGGVYSFNYRTGELIFTNITNDKSFMEFVRSKLSEDSNEKTIKSVQDDSNYKEIKTLKDKIEKISVSDAEGKISGNNATQSSNKTYTMVYNSNTKKYDIYNLEEVLNSNDVVQSENEKIYKNYELVEFYNAVNKQKKEKSLSGIIMFTLSILAIFSALYLLIRRKQLRGES